MQLCRPTCLKILLALTSRVVLLLTSRVLLLTSRVLYSLVEYFYSLVDYFYSLVEYFTHWSSTLLTSRVLLLTSHSSTAASSKTYQLLYAYEDHIKRTITTSCTCHSLCLTIFGLAPCWPLSTSCDSESLIRLTLNMSHGHAFLDLIRVAQRYLSHEERGKSHLDEPYLTSCMLLANPKATFMTTQLRSSVW